ncbi:unnamed protein product [Enterobius vermicularis]|uniref:Secreted protein n=1 Tax=Enterobius vermicularis TaxID=51028 RepID=A0A0N4UWW0_ENTVE|nr:unnamed protein product [Enterobius vermicularis]
MQSVHCVVWVNSLLVRLHAIAEALAKGQGPNFESYWSRRLTVPGRIQFPLNRGACLLKEIEIWWRISSEYKSFKLLSSESG